MWWRWGYLWKGLLPFCIFITPFFRCFQCYLLSVMFEITHHSHYQIRVSTSSGASSTPSASGKTLAELAHIRRRKSTGAKQPPHLPGKSRSNTTNITGLHASYSPVQDGLGLHQRSATSSATPTTSTSGKRALRASTSSKSLPSTPRLAKAALSSQAQPPLPPPPYLDPSKSTFAPNNIPSSVSQSSYASQSTSSEPRPDQRFSTADRTILEELKRSIEARQNQFVSKGANTSTGCAISRQNGKKHHNFSREEAPYPRNYESEVLDL
jgi:hypothetical protein